LKSAALVAVSVEPVLATATLTKFPAVPSQLLVFDAP